MIKLNALVPQNGLAHKFDSIKEANRRAYPTMTIEANLDRILCFTDECERSLHLSTNSDEENIFAVKTSRFEAPLPRDHHDDSIVDTFCGVNKAIDDNDELLLSTSGNARPSDFDLYDKLAPALGAGDDDHLDTEFEDEDSIVLSRHRVKQIEDLDTDFSDDDSIDEFAGGEALVEYEVVMDFTSEETKDDSRTLLENSTSTDGTRRVPRRRAGRRSPGWERHAATRRRHFEIHLKRLIESYA